MIRNLSLLNSSEVFTYPLQRTFTAVLYNRERTGQQKSDDDAAVDLEEDHIPSGIEYEWTSDYDAFICPAVSP